MRTTTACRPKLLEGVSAAFYCLCAWACADSMRVAQGSPTGECRGISPQRVMAGDAGVNPADHPWHHHLRDGIPAALQGPPCLVLASGGQPYIPAEEASAGACATPGQGASTAALCACQLPPGHGRTVRPACSANCPQSGQARYGRECCGDARPCACRGAISPICSGGRMPCRNSFWPRSMRGGIKSRGSSCATICR